MHQAIYRALRPDTFAGIIGQTAVTETLKNQIISGRASHAYLFCGTRGTGKTTTAKVFSKALCCHAPVQGEPCGVCPSCLAIAQDASMDVIEMDAAANNGVDNIRQLRDSVVYPPQIGKKKVYIIDEAHVLSRDANNALLKTLEEPPAHAVFILATTEPQSLLPTILSRCQRFDFRRVSTPLLRDHLALACQSEGAGYDDSALWQIARAGEGSVRDSLSLLDLCIATGQGNVDEQTVRVCLGTSGRDFLFSFADACAAGDMAACYRLIDELLRSGREIGVFVRELAEHMRQLLVAAACPEQAGQLLEISDEDAARMADQAQRMGAPRALRAMELLAKTETDLRQSTQGRVLLELAVVKICRPQTQDSVEALQDRLRVLEQAIASGAAAPAPTARSAPAKPAASKPAPAPKPKPQGDAGVWQAVLAQLKPKHVKLFFSLKQAAFYGVKDGVASIVFPAQQRVHVQACQKEENKTAISAAFEEVLGAPVLVEFDVEKDDAQNGGSGPDSQAVLEMARQTFGSDRVQWTD